MYPHEKNPFNGIFVYEQEQAIKAFFPDVSFDVYFINGQKSKFEYAISFLSVNRRISKGKYDLVHIHFGLSGLYLFSPFTHRIPTLITFHGSDIQSASTHNYWMVKISKKVAKKVDAAITLNDGMDKLVRTLNPSTYKIPCAVDMNVFHDKGCRKRNIERKSVRILFPSSRNRQVKNYPLFGKTIDILRSTYGFHVVEYELVNKTREEINNLYNTVDVLLLTSKSEGSPQVIKEAMACNLPCVCTPVGDVAFLLDGVKDCYVSKNHDSEELAELVVKSLKRDGNGISGREKIYKLGLDQKNIAEKLYHVYKSLIAKE